MGNAIDRALRALFTEVERQAGADMCPVAALDDSEEPFPLYAVCDSGLHLVRVGTVCQECHGPNVKPAPE